MKKLSSHVYSYILIIAMLFLFSCVLKNDRRVNGKEDVRVSELPNRVESINYTEFKIFWDEFRNALLQNNTSQLSLLIDDDFNGFCSPNLDVSSISKINFQKDSTFTKQRFIEEFYNNLNPVYIELLTRCEKHWMNSHVRKTNDSKQRDRCFQTVDKSTFYVDLNIDQDIINENVIVVFCFRSNDNEFKTKNIRLLFCKSDIKKIKLCKIDCYYLYVDDF